MKKILFIDDDEKYMSIIKDVLEKNDYIVDTVSSSTEGIELAKENDYDVYLIDLYLDQFQGVQVGEILRIENKDAPIVYISNSTDSYDELRCLKTGGAEFIKKDASIEIFLERLRKAIFEKKSEDNKDVLTSKDENLEINSKKGFVTKNGEYIHLTSTEFKILLLLVENKNDTLSRETMAEEIWQIPANELVVELRTIDTHIKNIKKKLAIKSIVSVRGVGYRWYEKK